MTLAPRWEPVLMPMIDLFNRGRARWVAWRCRRADRQLVRIQAQFPGLFESRMRDTLVYSAQVIAQREIMRFFDDQGFLHCAECPVRLSLRNLGPRRYCPKHYPIAEQKSKLTPGAPAGAPRP